MSASGKFESIFSRSINLFIRQNLSENTAAIVDGCQVFTLARTLDYSRHGRRKIIQSFIVIYHYYGLYNVIYFIKYVFFSLTP